MSATSSALKNHIDQSVGSNPEPTVQFQSAALEIVVLEDEDRGAGDIDRLDYVTVIAATPALVAE